MPRAERPSGDDGGLISPAAIDRWPRGVSCEGGFRLLGTPLGFIGSSNPGLLFIASVDDPVPRQDPRVLATPFAAAAIGAERRDLDALTLGFGRKIRLGRMDISMVPAGLDPGSAQLEIGFKDRRIVFCGGVRLKAPLFAPPVETMPCDLLLLDVAPAEPRPGSPKRVATKLARWISDQLAAGQVPAVVCGSAGAAIDAAWTLSRMDVPTRACRPLFEMIRRVERFGLPFPRLRRLEQSYPDEGALLHLARLWPGREADLPVAYAGPGRERPAWADAAFRLGEGEDRPGLVSYVKKTGAAKVALGPRCDRSTASMLTNAGVAVYRVGHPTQIPLPL
jgi:hypothetical protein